VIGLGAHAEFIVAAYAGVFAGLALLVGWTLGAAYLTRRRLDSLGERERDRSARP